MVFDGTLRTRAGRPEARTPELDRRRCRQRLSSLAWTLAGRATSCGFITEQSRSPLRSPCACSRAIPKALFYPSSACRSRPIRPHPERPLPHPRRPSARAAWARSTRRCSRRSTGSVALKVLNPQLRRREGPRRSSAASSSRRDHLEAAPPEHHHRHRLRADRRRHLLHRDGVPRGRDARRSCSRKTRPLPWRARARHRRSRSAGRCARRTARRHSPRPQARERDAAATRRRRTTW